MPDERVLVPEMVEPLERHALDIVVRVDQVDLAERRSHGAYLAPTRRRVTTAGSAARLDLLLEGPLAAERVAHEEGS